MAYERQNAKALDDYERQNAKEWQMNTDADSGSKDSEQDASDEDDADYADYIKAQYNTDEVSDAAFASEWTQVSHKKPPAKALASSPGKIPAKLARKPLGKVGKTPGGPSASSRPLPRPSTHPNLKLPPKNALLKSPARAGPPPATPVHLSGLPPKPVSMPPAQPARPRVTMTAKRDNPAKAAFRAHHPHTDTFLLPKACHLIEPDRQRVYAIMEEMGVRLGSFIRPPQHSRDQTLLLWGDDEQVAATKEELEIWIRQSATARSSQKEPLFAKSGALSDDKARQIDRGMKREAEKLAFQKAPPPDKTFDCTGYFLWPVDEIRPEELLGPNFEAFDQIRMFHCAYIVFDSQYSCFKIMSDNMDGVKDALMRIQGTMKEYVARSSQDIVLHVIEAPNSTDMRKDIKTADALCGPNFEGARIPLLTGAKLTPSELATWESQRRKMVEEQFEKTRAAIRKGLSRLRYYRGRIRMRVLLGTFALTTFRRLPEGVSSIPFDKFLGDMNMSATKGRMIKEWATSWFASGSLADISPVSR